MTRTLALLALLALASPAMGNATEAALDSLVTPDERAFLLETIAAIDPPTRICELAEFGSRQSALGGGFYGMLPDQLTPADSLPVPADEDSRLAAVLVLARQRETNRAALAALNPDYPVTFGATSLADFLLDLPASELGPPPDGDALRLALDLSAVRGFLAARADGAIDRSEAAALAALPSNVAMLEHRRNLGYVPEPLPDAEALAAFIGQAGSPDPLDRLWCWVSSQNAFGYADLAEQPTGYGDLVAQLNAHGDALAAAVLGRIARFAPEDARLETTFAFTVGWAIRGWATPAMAGLNVEQVKDDWDFLYGTLVEETYHRLQLELFPSADGAPARTFDDLVAADTGDPRLDRLQEILAYTAAEGAANLVRGRFAPAGLDAKAPEGAALLARFVGEVVEGGNLEAADALINEGLRGNGPLYGLGLRLATAIADTDGDHAVGEWQQRGAAAFVLRGAGLSAAGGTPLLAADVVAAVERLR